MMVEAALFQTTDVPNAFITKLIYFVVSKLKKYKKFVRMKISVSLNPPKHKIFIYSFRFLYSYNI